MSNVCNEDIKIYVMITDCWEQWLIFFYYNSYFKFTVKANLK